MECILDKSILEKEYYDGYIDTCSFTDYLFKRLHKYYVLYVYNNSNNNSNNIYNCLVVLKVLKDELINYEKEHPKIIEDLNYLKLTELLNEMYVDLQLNNKISYNNPFIKIFIGNVDYFIELLEKIDEKMFLYDLMKNSNNKSNNNLWGE